MPLVHQVKKISATKIMEHRENKWKGGREKREERKKSKRKKEGVREGDKGGG